MTTMKDILASDNTFVLNVRNQLAKLLTPVPHKELDAVMEKSDRECQAHDYLDKHLRYHVQLGRIYDGLNYKMFMCSCGAFSCENNNESLAAVWGLASHDPAIREICRLIMDRNDYKIAALWLKYVYEINHTNGNMIAFVNKDLNL